MTAALRHGRADRAADLTPRRTESDGSVARFYAPDLASGRQDVSLPADESRHLRRVLRARIGDPVLVFDGRGAQFRARVATMARDVVTVHVEAAEPAPAPPAIAVTIGLSMLKGHALDDVVRDVTMLGAAAIQPIVSARSETGAAAARHDARTDRWRRIALASAKQCGRADLPLIRPARGFADAVSAESAALKLLLAEPSHGSGMAPGDALPPPSSAAIYVGPEGGWAPDEVEHASACGFTPLRLGPRTLRAVAAPIVALAALQCVWRDL